MSGSKYLKALNMVVKLDLIMHQMVLGIITSAALLFIKVTNIDKKKWEDAICYKMPNLKVCLLYVKKGSEVLR